MVKSFISLIVAFLLIIFASAYEQHYINKSFLEFKEVMVAVYEKIENENAVKDDVLSAQKLWISKKEKLHIFIPHNDIKEIELWLSEAVTLVEYGKKEDALSKIDVVIELIEQIPKIYSFKIENIL
ncbi:MAG: DUF4363 family protein [Clostridia bacterium]|nr:DUF4363 family protein [Clostridia bacterium]